MTTLNAIFNIVKEQRVCKTAESRFLYRTQGPTSCSGDQNSVQAQKAQCKKTIRNSRLYVMSRLPSPLSISMYEFSTVGRVPLRPVYGGAPLGKKSKRIEEHARKRPHPPISTTTY